MKFRYILILILIVLNGCTEKKESVEDVVVYLGKGNILKSDFIAAFEVSKIGYDTADVIRNNNAIKKRLLGQLVEEEIVILNARENGFVYSHEEFKKDIVKVKKEYPEGVFEKLLEENAITFDVWKQRFRKEQEFKKAMNFLVDKKLKFSVEEIKKAYLDYCNEFDLDMKNIKDNESIKNKVMKRLKSVKSSKLYKELFIKLKKDADIRINNKVWLSLLNKY